MIQIFSHQQGAKAHLLGALLCSHLLFLSACTTTTLIQDDLDPRLWQQRQDVLAQLEMWSFNGRVAVRAESNDAWNVSLHWQQSGEQFDIKLAGAFGQGGARLQGNEHQAIMTMADQVPQIAPSVEALMQAELGWHVPVKGLRYWLTGRPAPGLVELRQLDQQGRLQHLQQDGWQVLFRRYMSIDDALELPRKLELSNPRLRLRLVIDQWQLDEAAKG